MFFDVLIVVIVVLCAVYGFRAGFLISLTRLVGWVGALLLAFLFHNQVAAWILAHTDWYARLGDRILLICNQFVSLYENGATSQVPAGVAAAASTDAAARAAEVANSLTGHVFTILVFVGIILGIKIILLVLTLLFSKKFHGGFLGFVDGFVGLLLGLFSSVIAILVIFALIMPLSYTLNPSAYAFIQSQMDNSIIASFIYQNNPLLDIINGFVPNELNPERWLSEAAASISGGSGGGSTTLP
ncbi:MAG: CvpA family protein [Clostridiales bacterium]|nr:CvpA family protein [Clostridiales bacterium]